jgi:acyl transferase domain-containing protein/NAD(P)H-dependent flavin oxidoreductase YrpB (nitropropane dioxygenase family)/NAD(P)-dependent dehydrogenase (short-subunit alcohol dehydrogenase family)/acyl carrier protein
MLELSDVIALAPAGSTEVGVAVAANRLGARGFVDLEWSTDGVTARELLAALRRFCPNRFGVKLGRDAGQLLPQLLEGAKPAWVILAGGDRPDLGGELARLRQAGVEVLFEAVGLAEAQRGVALGVDGIILKGHESGGRVGADSSFLLLQKWNRWKAERSDSSALPVWLQGGIGPHTAAAGIVAGVCGVVLDTQLLLARESPLADGLKRRLRAMDGSETVVLGEKLGRGFRCYTRPDRPEVQELAKEEARLLASESPPEARLAVWRRAIAEADVWPLGPDAALAAPLADKHVTVSGIIQALVAEANRLADLAGKLTPLAEGSELARRHGTRYPILQGPMTRVSDTAAFAESVAAAGGLPFLALALLRKAETERLLNETRERLASSPSPLVAEGRGGGEKPWGVGILGFVPPEIRSEQLAAVRACKPPFAIIAGGRPDQAKELEEQGIHTYLHVPSPGLLRQFLKDGARRFIFEGRECGGHVGPRTSFVLWETMVGVLRDWAAAGGKAEELHIVFAGGIHDALSAAMVSALSAALTEKGAAVGVLMGTAYLFTHEAVPAGAITERFQKAALACDDTVLLETGPGHAIRCIPTPYADTFEAEKRRLQAEGKSPLEVGLALERMNLGRLRVASKGLDRAPVSGNGTRANSAGLVALSDDEQFRRGMYMIGQVAGLRDKVVSMAELHEEVCTCATQLLASRSSGLLVSASPEPKAPPPCDIAVIGLACFYPKSGGLWPYWENILGKVNAVTEVPASHWDWRPYYDPDPRAPDKIISKWGGFLDDTTFDPLIYGITPKSIASIEPMQLLLLEAVRHALADAGYADRPFARDRVAAILGVGGGGAPLSVSLGMRACLPMLDSVPDMPVKSAQILQHSKDVLPEWTEDSFPGILLNVAVGRVSNRFNFGGPNMAIDAACGSSLAALQAGVRELEMGTSDLAVVMGADAMQTPFAYVAFSKTFALSPRGRCRPFDAEADGIALAEGIGVAILKRLADAERDGDRIYAVVKGVGSSSDGRDKGLTAPRAEGQLRALRRAYAQAHIPAAEIGLVEAHGTGTVVGDQTEATAVGQLWREAGAAPQSVALGSVKSMIGHAKCAAGLAGLIKATLALHHKVLPPTLVEKPNPRANLDGGPLYLNTETRPWVKGDGRPRRAGVSAFGFGGTNFHVVLEEYTNDPLDRASSGLKNWPAELFVWRRPDKAALIKDIRHCRDVLTSGAVPTLGDLAASLWKSSKNGDDQPTLAVVAGSLEDLREKLDIAVKTLTGAEATLSDPRGIYFAEKPGAANAQRPTSNIQRPSRSDANGAKRSTSDVRPKVAFLFPGQGSQYPNMLAQLAIAFPEVREVLDAAEGVLAGKLERPLGRLIYPPSPFTPEQEQAAKEALQRTEVAQPAVGTTSLAMHRLLSLLGVEPNFLAGHSYGEYAALAAAGSIPFADLIRLSHRRGEVIRAASPHMPGGMIAVEAGADAVTKAVAGLTNITVANHNSPKQTVIAADEAGLLAAAEKLQVAGLRNQRIPVACGFHSPLVAAAREPLAQVLAEVPFASPRQPVFSNTTAKPHDGAPQGFAARLAEHLVSPVRFREEVEALYEAGTRIFVEVGPQAVLTGLVGQTLEGRPHIAVASDQKGRPSLIQLAHLLGQLLTNGVSVKLDRLFQGRELKTFDVARMSAETGKPKYTPTTWAVNGVRSRPINAPEPRLLGQAPRSAERKPSSERKPNSELGTRNSELPSTVTPVRPNPSVPVPRVTMSQPETTTASHTTPTFSGSNGQPHAAGPVPDGAAQVLLRFQEVMARFLDTQKSVMLSFLGGAPASAHPAMYGYAAQPNGHVPPVGQRPVGPAINGHTGNGHVAPTPDAIAARSVSVTPADDASAATAQKKPEALDPKAMLAQLLDLVSERTGYPKESLSVDQDLEADLGVDSIKRVEILSNLADTLGDGDAKDSPLEMEKLTSIKTIRGIVDYVIGALANAERGARNAERTSEPADSAGDEANGSELSAASSAFAAVRRADVQRLVVRLIDAPLPARLAFNPPSGTILLTDDRQGSARELADRLAELDVKTVLLHDRTVNPDAAADAFAADLSDPAAVGQLIGRLRSEVGPIAGVIHLLPLAEPVEGEDLARRARRDVYSIYLLARGLEAELRQAGREQGGAVLLAATGMGGGLAFGDAQLPEPFLPGHGAITGFLKCIAFEWPDVFVRAVDLDPDRPATEHAERLLAELGDPRGPREVGYLDGRRVTPQTEPGPVDKEHQSPIRLGPDSLVLATGGARGITAKVALELAKRFRPTLVLVGRSPLPAPEPIHLARLESPADLKTTLMADFKREGKAHTPAAVEQAYLRLKQDREIRANIEAIRQAGAKVRYYAADVRDPAAFGELLDRLQKEFGKIDGVIHGAGVIEDKLLKDKTPESFERVFGTKVDSTLTLAKKLDPERTQFLVLFSSLASRYGNLGQSDYAAANDTLCKLAAQLDRRWAGRATAMAWGPWAGVGMVAHLEKHLVNKGLQLISPEAGPVYVIEELLHGRKGDHEVVIAGGTEQSAHVKAEGGGRRAEPASV